MLRKRKTIRVAMEALRETMSVVPENDPSYFPPPEVMRLTLSKVYEELRSQPNVSKYSKMSIEAAARLVLRTLSVAFDLEPRPVMASWCRAAVSRLETYGAAPSDSGNRVWKVVAGLAAPLLIVAAMKLPFALSKVEKVNAMSAVTEQRARAECNQQLALLGSFIKLARDLDTDQVSEDVREVFVRAITASGATSNGDVEESARMIWAQREYLLQWKKAKVAQKTERCIERRMQRESARLVDWLPLSEGG